MHETLTALGREKEYSTIMGKISSIGFGVPIILTILIPFFVEISYKIPFLVMGVVDIIGLIAVLSLTRPPVTAEHIEEIQTSNFKMVMKEAYSLNYFTIAIFSGILSAFLLGTAAFRAPYQVYLGVPVIWFGVFIGLGRALASFMLIYSGKMEKYFTLASFYRFQYLIHVLIIALVGLFQNVFVVVFLLTLNSGIHWGLSKVDEGFQLRVIGSSKFKATLLSTGAQIESLITALIGVFLGWLIQKYSYGLGFLYISLIVGVVLTLLHIRMRRAYDKT
jgi:MFS family permease